MSFSIGALANGLAGANDRILKQQQYDAELKRQAEEQTYNRQRQATADQQATELHQQNVKRNDFALQAGLKEQEEQKRVDDLKSRIGTLQGYKSTGDTDGAFNYALDYMNKSNESNPNWNQSHHFAYLRDPDNPMQATLNIVDKTTGNLVRQVNNAANTDSLIDMFILINPVQAYENKVANQAKASEELKKQDWELQKMKTEHNYKLDEATHKGKIDSVSDNARYQSNLNLEGIRQQGAYQREVIQQEGQDYRLGTKIENGSSNSPKASKVVQGGVQGALAYAQKNLPTLQFLASNPEMYQKTLAMMAIESGGNPTIHSYYNSSYGLMQLNKKYARGFAKQFNIEGDPLTNPQSNLRAGAALVQHLHNKYQGNNDLIAAAYNAGEPRIDQALKSWSKAGRKGNWFDYLQINAASRQQVMGHIIKYNQALSLLANQSTPMNANAASTEYSQKTSAKSTDSIKTVSSNMTEELGYKGKNNAMVLGGLSGIQPHVVQFVSSPDQETRAASYNNIFSMVQRVIERSPLSTSMTPKEKNAYTHQKTAELVGAKDIVEVGQWINKGSRPQPKQQAAATPSIDFSQINMTTPTPTKQPTKTTTSAKPLPVTVARPKPKTGNIENPFMTNALKGNLNKLMLN